MPLPPTRRLTPQQSAPGIHTDHTHTHTHTHKHTLICLLPDRYQAFMDSAAVPDAADRESVGWYTAATFYPALLAWLNEENAAGLKVNQRFEGDIVWVDPSDPEQGIRAARFSATHPLAMTSTSEQQVECLEAMEVRTSKLTVAIPTHLNVIITYRVVGFSPSRQRRLSSRSHSFGRFSTCSSISSGQYTTR